MKKLYLFAAASLFAAMPLSARELSFYLENTKIENEAKLTYTDVERSDYGDGYESITIAPKLYITSDIFTNTVNITANCVSGQQIQLCAGGNCMKGTEVTKTGVSIQNGEMKALEFDYVDFDHAVADPIPTVVTEISAVDTKHQETAISFTITLSGNDAGVADMFINDADFRAISGGIAYSFEAPTKVTLYTVAGETVMETTLEGNGTLSTAALPTGIYLYKAGKKSGKLYIR